MGKGNRKKLIILPRFSKGLRANVEETDDFRESEQETSTIGGNRISSVFVTNFSNSFHGFSIPGSSARIMRITQQK